MVFPLPTATTEKLSEKGHKEAMDFRRQKPPQTTIACQIKHLKTLGLSNSDIYEHLVVWMLQAEKKARQIECLCYENARQARGLLGLDRWHTCIEFGYWIDKSKIRRKPMAKKNGEKNRVETKKPPAQYRLLPVGDILPSGDNPRTINEKSETFCDLVKDIRGRGVIVPLHVRSHPKKKGKYELLAGERRLRAAARVGLVSVGCLDYGSIGDEVAFEITFAENFCREDLTPLEQGKAVVTLLAKYKGDSQAVASKMSRSVRWVFQRAAIHKNLIPKWKKAITEDSGFKDWTASHLQLVAAFPANVQNEIFEYYEYEDVVSVKNLEKELAGRLRLVSKAKWDTKEALPVTTDKGTNTVACNKCNKRTSVQPGLFDDTTDKETITKNDRCLDQDCWANRMNVWLRRRAQELSTDHSGVVFVCSKDTSYYQRQDFKEALGTVMSPAGYNTSKEKARGAIPALMVNGPSAGDVLWIKPKKETSYNTRKRTSGPTPLKQRRDFLKRKRWFVVIEQLVELVEESRVDKLVTNDTILTVLAIAATRGTTFEFGQQGSWKAFLKITNRDEALKKLWENLRVTIAKDLTYCGPITQTPDGRIRDAKFVAGLLDIDIEAMFKEVCRTKYPEPKSWANLNADGTPKAKEKTPKKKTRSSAAGTPNAKKKTPKKKSGKKVA